MIPKAVLQYGMSGHSFQKSKTARILVLWFGYKIERLPKHQMGRTTDAVSAISCMSAQLYTSIAG